MGSQTDAPHCPRCPSGSMRLVKVSPVIGCFPELRSFVCHQCLEVVTIEAGLIENIGAP